MTETIIIIPDRPFKGQAAEPVAVKEPPEAPKVMRQRRKNTTKTPGGGDPVVHKVEGE